MIGLEILIIVIISELPRSSKAIKSVYRSFWDMPVGTPGPDTRLVARAQGTRECRNHSAGGMGESSYVNPEMQGHSN